MIELFEQDRKTEDRQSSKGNQLKWLSQDRWYKADYTGYEGLTEFIISNLLIHSTLRQEEFVLYETEKIRYGAQEYLGCSSRNFLRGGWQLITLERLFQNHYGQSLNRSLYCMESHENRLRFLVEQTERITGLPEFGVYISKLLTLDTFFLNEDRHTHNIAVLMNGEGEYRYCPVFDNGAGLLSDTAMDYPLRENTNDLIGRVRARTFCQDFDEQLDIAERLYGQHIRFDFDRERVWELLKREENYPETVKMRVADILMNQRRKYGYLFSSV